MFVTVQIFISYNIKISYDFYFCNLGRAIILDNVQISAPIHRDGCNLDTSNESLDALN